MLLVHSRKLIFKGETMPVCVKQLKKSFYEGKRGFFCRFWVLAAKEVVCARGSGRSAY